MRNITMKESLNPSTDLELFYDDLLQHFPGWVFVTDNDGKVVYVTDSIEQMFEKKTEWFIGKYVKDIVKEGLLTETSAQDALKRDKKVKYLTTTTGVTMLILSVPIYDNEGNRELVVTFASKKGEYEKAYLLARREGVKYEHVIRYLSEFNGKQTQIVAESSSMKNLLSVTRRIAETDSTIMINGESGTGKEVIAHYIHNCSNRRSKAFIPVNCAAIPAELAEAQFFGYEKGAFTGANKDGKAGLFEFADKGTLFLDEIGDLPLPIQSKLLRVLETGTVSRVGGGEKLKNVDVRIIAATHRNLFQEVQNGNFREDLYYRLNVFPVTIAPLRERPDDIEALAQVFLDKYNQHYHTAKIFDPHTIHLLKLYKWPGNVRELRNIVERLALLSTGLITPDLLDHSFTQSTLSVETAPSDTSIDYEQKSLKARLKEYEALCIHEALNQNKGDVTLTAQALEMPVSTLYQKIRTYGIQIKN